MPAEWPGHFLRALAVEAAVLVVQMGQAGLDHRALAAQAIMGLVARAAPTLDRPPLMAEMVRNIQAILAECLLGLAGVVVVVFPGLAVRVEITGALAVGVPALLGILAERQQVAF